LANKSINQEVEKQVFDVNALAIYLVNDHPGYTYISPVVEAGLRGTYIPVIMDILPVRAFWIMTKKWGCGKKESSDAIAHFVQAYDRPSYGALKRETILESFRLADELGHNVFDCVYLAFALQEKATAILTTDTDFERLCKHVGVTYNNPVPKDILKYFKEQNK
jgi:predicted nucleic acid-binding protein